MANEKISTYLNCKSIAPIQELNTEIKTNSLKIGVFANNGSGKTFLSRLFRLTENNEELFLDENGRSPTDKLLTFGKDKGEFSLKIIGKDRGIKEDFSIIIEKGIIPNIPQTQYIYHTFNQDYVEQNIQILGYEKDSDIQGYILGKVNIDLKEEEDNLLKIQKEEITLTKQIEKNIFDFLEEKVDNIQNIKRLNEYNYLKPVEVFKSIDKGQFEVSRSLEELYLDYNKIKSVPENLADIDSIESISIDLINLKKLKDNLIKSFSLSSLAEDFKLKIKGKQGFIEAGMILLLDTNNKHCPFCEQQINDKASLLIDNYNSYIEDTESRTIKELKASMDMLLNLLKLVKTIKTENSKRIVLFSLYKSKYIPSISEIELIEIVNDELESKIKRLIQHVEDKINDISKCILVDEAIIQDIEKQQTLINSIIHNNNLNLNIINSKKNKISEENKTIRKDICKAAYNYLAEVNKSKLHTLLHLKKTKEKISEEIKKKKNQQKTSRREKVSATIKLVLNYFFLDKYTLDEETFRLVFYENTLEKNQVKEVLSEGEKNIIAFAYFIGDTHLKVETEGDYEKIFFIIDDPISSMDFTHVYTLSGIIRNFSNIITELNKERFIIFTHNNDFMRVLSSNNIIDKKLLLKNGKLLNFNNNLTVPYINHLLDVYNVARNGESANHTTANSIRHIIETLTKFQTIDISQDGIAEYIKINIPNDTTAYTLINDLSHGGWRSEQSPITDDDYKIVCEAIITHIEKTFKGQIEYCKKSEINNS